MLQHITTIINCSNIESQQDTVMMSYVDNDSLDSMPAEPNLPPIPLFTPDLAACSGLELLASAASASGLAGNELKNNHEEVAFHT